jgi:valyl-tRNA synthetase
VVLRGVLEAGKERERLEREVKRTEKNIVALDKKLGAKGFAERAPPEVVAESHAALGSERERLRMLQEALTLVGELE